MCITSYVNTVTALVLNWLVCEYNIVPYNLCVGTVTEPWNQYAQHTVKSTFESYLPHMWSSSVTHMKRSSWQYDIYLRPEWLGRLILKDLLH